MQGHSTHESTELPLSVVRRWAMKAGAVGLLLGVAAGSVALLTQ